MKGIAGVSVVSFVCMFAAAPVVGEEATTAGTAIQTGSSDGCPPGSHRDQAALDQVYKKYSDPSELAQLVAAERGVPCVKDDRPALGTIPAGGADDKLAPAAAMPPTVKPLLPAAKPPRR